MKTDGAGNRRAFRVTVYRGTNTYPCVSRNKGSCRGAIHEVELDLEGTDMVLTLCRSHVRELHAALADV